MHAPFTQPDPGTQPAAQAPQLFGSLVKSTQTAAHNVWLASGGAGTGRIHAKIREYVQQRNFQSVPPSVAVPERIAEESDTVPLQPPACRRLIRKGSAKLWARARKRPRPLQSLATCEFDARGSRKAHSGPPVEWRSIGRASLGAQARQDWRRPTPDDHEPAKTPGLVIARRPFGSITRAGRRLRMDRRVRRRRVRSHRDAAQTSGSARFRRA